MSYEPLHHKYRPQTFAELVGQEAIATTLANAITLARIAPAYLFTGPRGTGKTSSARILAKSLNCVSGTQPTPQPCGKCEMCMAIARGSALDVIEIDAASNTGVDNIREIIERAQFSPLKYRYKVYVIDECHMLSTAAFNALLKTLEEPPPSVVFVLATTDPQKVLPTIISRCQRFDYRRISIGAMVTHLEKIAREEKIEISTEAITLVAQLANGGLRDAQSLLDQLSLFSGEITSERIWDLVGATPEQDLIDLLQAIATGTPVSILQKCRELLNRGLEPLIVLQNLASFYLNLLIAKTGPQQLELVTVTPQTWQKLLELTPQWSVAEILKAQQYLKQSEIQIKNTTQPYLWLEATLLGLIPKVEAVIPSIIPETPKVEVAPPTPSTTTEKSIKAIYTDGSCLGNPGPGGWAYVVYSPQGVLAESGGHEHNTTNQRMELSGAIAALDYLEQTEYKDPVILYTDSEYVIKGITQWINGWKKNNWQTSAKKPVVNQDLWQRLDLLNSQLNVTWEHVRGHQGNEGNERADEIARSYASQNSTSVKAESYSNSETWQKILQNLEPPTTRALLIQQGVLINFDGAIARVGISSEKLLKLHKGKIANLEAAFSQTFGRSIKVTLEVANTEQEKKNDLVSFSPVIEPKTPPQALPVVEPKNPPQPSPVVEPKTPTEKQLQQAIDNLVKQFKGVIIP
ncbi:DNA polymerase III subunit gamma/tau [Gloeocapsa sp. PCC 73106]|uniref:DNA polymerase III subunit gamma/tau n=1 Tax=Gloeocapsa sp. PCC 73106 TaxID=102232 RepID=UPI0008FC005F|nr:DNA polymerase III subunit gamma/tau [Gloeocapsa sp. PCC 73106]